MKHYRLDVGIACEVRRPGETTWTPHTMTRRMFFAGRTDDNGLWVFETGGFKIRVHPKRVRGSAASLESTSGLAKLTPGEQPRPGWMVLTSDNLHALASGGCGFTKQQLELLGVAWPPPAGWLKERVGTTIRESTYERISELKGIKSKKWKKRKPKVVTDLAAASTSAQNAPVA